MDWRAGSPRSFAKDASLTSCPALSRSRVILAMTWPRSAVFAAMASFSPGFIPLRGLLVRGLFSSFQDFLY